MTKLVLGFLIAVATAAPAAAQICGDANGDGNVTVTDGVQALRAAAGLSSTCDAGCDVDGNGTVTVTDGVNILRKAAGLGIVEACDFTTAEANSVVNPSLSIFDAITKIPGVGTASVDEAATTAPKPCDNDGTIVTSVGTTGAASTVTFTNCQLKESVFNGVVGRVALGSGFGLSFQNFMITHLLTGKSITHNGQLTVTFADTGKIISGKLDNDSTARGMFSTEFERILIATDGSIVQGILIYDLTNATTPKVAMIRITFNATDEIPVTITFRNGQVRQFILDRTSRLLHPAV
jgi:hypothetical protein